ncbi:MAG: hypothetical protein HY291_00480 [Planctomycetes bacterium]|nr:hypothetical protein [Planctomycetota bacterium]
MATNGRKTVVKEKSKTVMREREGGTSVDWRGRQRRQRLFGAFKLFVFVGILGVLVGLGIVYKTQLMALFQPKQQVVVAPPPAPPPEKKVEVVEKTPDVPKAPIVEEKKTVVVEDTKKVAPPVEFSAEEDKKAQELIAQGRKQMETIVPDPAYKEHMLLDFDGAKQKFQMAVGMKAAPKTHDDATTWVKKAGEFKLATKHIEISEFATTESAAQVTMTNGNVMRGIVKQDTNEFLELQTVSADNPASLGRSTFKIPKGEVGKPVPLSLQDRQRDFKDFLSKLESGMELGGAAAGTDYYDLVFLSKRLGLGAECVEYLNKAFEKTKDGRVADTFRKLIIDRYLERATKQAAANRKVQANATLTELLRLLPDYQVAKDEVEVFRAEVLAKIKEDFKSTIVMAKKTAPPPTPENKQPVASAKDLAAEAASSSGPVEEIAGVDSSGVVGKGAAASIVQKANDSYEKGMAAYRKYTQGTKGNNNAVLEEAEKYLDKAVDLYGEALEKDPSNKAIENRQVEANMILYATRKYHTLN